MTNQQLAFQLPHRAALGRGDFFVAEPNALAVAQIDGWRDWPQRKLLLIGPSGAGKSHLARVWADMADARIIAASDLTGADIPALAQAGAVAIEDVDRIAGDRAAEEALFHLHNLALAEGGSLLMTARNAPRLWPLGLPDLASRLLATPTATLAGPDDALLSAVLVKLFNDRQLVVAPALIPYLVGRMERSFAAANTLVAALDDRALAEGRKVSSRLAAEVLDNPGAHGP